MKEYEFLSSIDNKEILTEILNQSIDFLIGNQDEQQTMRMCHKYGFHNPDDFLLATRSLAKLYQELCCSEPGGMSDASMELTRLTPELQVIMSSVLSVRQSEVLRFLIRGQNANDCPLVEWFDWGSNLVLGDSSFANNTRILTSLTLHLRLGDGNKKETYQSLHFQMNLKKLDDFIGAMEQMVKECDK